MREILFRGKRIDNGEWVEGDFIAPYFISPYQNSELYINETFVNGKSVDGIVWCQGSFYRIDPSTVGQYTGLKDKNGNRIFEWDIVKTDKFSEQNKQYIIKYDLQFGAFIGQDRYNIYFVTFDGDSGEFEVIGNIYDNPELLEK